MFLGPLLSPAGIDFRQILPVHYKVHFFSLKTSSGIFFWRLDWCTFFSADVVKPVGFGSEVGCRIELGCGEWCGFLPQRNCRHSGPVCQRVSRAVSAVYHW